jgi:dynein heavy chain
MWMFKSLLSDYEEEAKYAAMERKNLIQGLQSKFIFSLVWSLGGSLTTEARKPFDTFLKRLLNGDMAGGDKRKRLQFPERGLLYDYCVTCKDTGEA